MSKEQKFNWPKGAAKGTVYYLDDYDFCGYCAYLVHTSDSEGFCGAPSQPWDDYKKRKITKAKNKACSEFLIKPPEKVADEEQCKLCGHCELGLVCCTVSPPPLGEICERNKK